MRRNAVFVKYASAGKTIFFQNISGFSSKCEFSNHKCSHVEEGWAAQGTFGDATTEYGAQYPGKEVVR